MIGLYRLASHFAEWLAPLLLRRRLAQGKEDATRLGERLGHAGLPRPTGALIWLHGASVGETLSALPLIDRILAAPSSPTVLVTSGTVTSAELMAKRLPPGAIHQFVPVDTPGAVGRFFAHWRPDLAIWLESEFWPNLLTAMKDGRVPALLVNGRISERSQRQWARFPTAARRLLSTFQGALAMSPQDAERLRTIGLDSARFAGDLKTAAEALPADEAALAELEAATAGRPLWLAASTHPGEEEIVAQAHSELRLSWPNLLTILAPRHPERGDEIATMLRGRGLDVAIRSRDDAVADRHDIYLADTLGELGLLYRLAPIAFVGGSLVDVGGHNPLEAARLDCAVLIGPVHHNFTGAAEDLSAAGGLKVIKSADALPGHVAALLTDPGEARAMATAGAEKAATGDEILDQAMAALGRLAPHLFPKESDA